MTMRYNAHVKTGNANTLVAGSVIAGNPVDMGDNTRQKVRNLSALVTVDCETDTLTMAGRWEVSNDGTTWVTVTNGTQNAAGVVFATGTGGADADVVRCFPASEAVYAWRKARFSIVTAAVTGNTVDTYSIGYQYRTNSVGD